MTTSDLQGNREFRQMADGWYRLVFLREGILLEVKRLRWERGELHGLLIVQCDLAGAKRVGDNVSVGTFNLTSVTARNGRAKDIHAQVNAPEIDWRLLLEDLCQNVLRAEQTGQPVILINQVQAPPDDAGLQVFGIPIPLRNPISIYSLGGAGKTTIAMAICGELERRGVPTLYLDWELNEFDHRHLAERLHGRDLANLDLKYRRCERPLALEVESIAQQIDECGIQYVILDSAGYASDGRPEDAEVALRYARALRQLHVGSLTLAHISSGEHGTEKPFGSVFWFNSFRATWYFERTTTDGENAITVGAFNKKNNLGRLHPAVGLRLAFGQDGTTITPTDLADDEQLAAKLPVSARMFHLLKSGPRTINEIAHEIDAKVDSVSKAIQRSKSFTRVPGADGVYRIALVERRIA